MRKTRIVFEDLLTKTMRLKIFIHPFLFLSLFVLAACGASSSVEPSKKPLILVSIAPYQFLAERIAGENFTIQTVVPPGSNPHVYEPTARQLSEISAGSIWFCIGESFESKILPILKKQNSHLVASDLRQGIDLIQTSHHSCSHCASDNEDRHIWLSPKSACKQALKIATELSKLFPEKENHFLENAAALTTELTLLDEEITQLLASLDNRSFLVSHPAFGYFCKEYNLTQLSVEQDGKEPRPKHVEEILRKATASNTKLAIALPQHSNKGLELIANKLDLSVHMINPYSAEYFETLRLLAHTLKNPYSSDKNSQ